MVVVPIAAPPPTPVTGKAIVYTGFTVYVKPAIVRLVVENVKVAIPWLNPRFPFRVPTKLPAPAGET